MADNPAMLSTSTQSQLGEAATRVISERGWEGMTLEHVAEAAGVSRSTLWRLGVTKESLTRLLLAGLSRSYREAVWPSLTMEGTGAERLRRALEALYDVADHHLALLAASDTAFHRASDQDETRTSFIEPLARLLRDGITDGSLGLSKPAGQVATVLFNTVWTYVHLRSRHGWDSSHARDNLLPLLLGSLRGEADGKDPPLL